ncbi:MAG: DUF5618 family protein [Chitinispirillales bacterium]|nr:DUF5618 family protein [Chitinispirillales bacterium]
MTNDEQNLYLSKEYAEAMRYMDNAKETLKRAVKQDDGRYKDEKYVRSACGIAYLGVLAALDAWLTLKGVEIPKKRKHTNINFYLSNVGRLDMKMLGHLNDAYNALHLDGYYRKVRNIKIIEGGFDEAYYIIEKIKPEHPVDVPESRGDMVKRVWDKMMVSLAVTFRF